MELLIKHIENRGSKLMDDFDFFNLTKTDEVDLLGRFKETDGLPRLKLSLYGLLRLKLIVFVVTQTLFFYSSSLKKRMLKFDV